MCYPQFRNLKRNWKVFVLIQVWLDFFFIHSTLFDFECWECECDWNRVHTRVLVHILYHCSVHTTPCSVHWLNTLSASKLRSHHTQPGNVWSCLRSTAHSSPRSIWMGLLSNLKVGVEKQKLLWPDYFRTFVLLNYFLILEIHFYIHPRNVSTLWEEMEIVLKRKGLMLGNWVWWELYASLFWWSELKVVWMFMLTFIWLISPGFKPTLVYN